ncbi:MAG TPA: bifunctional glycosyltransferase family 2/GtrA family protein [Candidatus Paceibacterota bacterium]|jgi:glycosyltransferase involved in cell wall biosynthesis
MKLSVIIPCYNESAHLKEVLVRTYAVTLPPGWSLEVVVVDDGSDQETKDAVAVALNAHPDLVHVERELNGGKGAALKSGFGAATGDYLVILDADPEYDPNDIPRLLAPVIEGPARVVFGVRDLKDNNAPGRFRYYWGGRLMNGLFNVAFGTRLSDITVCLKLFPHALVPELVVQPSDDFVFDAIELTRVLAREPFTEVPVSYAPRTALEGKKLKASHGIRMAMRIIELRLGRMARIARFLIVGSTAAAINLSILVLLTEGIGVWYLLSEGIAFLVALSFNFFCQRLWVFRNREKNRMRQAGTFLTVNLVNLALNVGLLYIFVEYFGLWYVVGQVLASVIIAIESYVVYRTIFR